MSVLLVFKSKVLKDASTVWSDTFQVVKKAIKLVH